jgi:hypothetical protein
MEQNTTQSLFGLKVDYESGSFFREATKWARFIAIVYFVLFVLAVSLIIFAGEFASGVFEQLVDQGVLPVSVAEFKAGLYTIVFVGGLIGLTMLALLYRFASLTRQGLETNRQASFNDGLKSLKYFFIISGVLTVLGIVISFIGTVAAFFI